MYVEMLSRTHLTTKSRGWGSWWLLSWVFDTVAGANVRCLACPTLELRSRSRIDIFAAAVRPAATANAGVVSVHRWKNFATLIIFSLPRGDTSRPVTRRNQLPILGISIECQNRAAHEDENEHNPAARDFHFLIFIFPLGHLIF